MNWPPSCFSILMIEKRLKKMKNKGKLVLSFLMATGFVMTSAGIYVANPGTGWATPADQEVSKQAKEGLSILKA